MGINENCKHLLGKTYKELKEYAKENGIIFDLEKYFPAASSVEKLLAAKPQEYNGKYIEECREDDYSYNIYVIHLEGPEIEVDEYSELPDSAVVSNISYNYDFGSMFD